MFDDVLDLNVREGERTHMYPVHVAKHQNPPLKKGLKRVSLSHGSIAAVPLVKVL